MQNTPTGWEPSGGTGSSSQRWAWTYRYGTPLLLASIVAVLLAGSTLAAVVALGSGGTTDPRTEPTAPSEPPASPVANPAPTGPPTTLNPTPTPRPVADVDPDCVIGSWRATTIVDQGATGIFELFSGEPIVAYREDGTGGIDYGEEGDGTTFQFEDTLFNSGTSHSSTFGVLAFEYQLVDGAVVHVYELFGGPRMLRIPYYPNEDTFTVDCTGDAMILDGDSGYLELERR